MSQAWNIRFWEYEFLSPQWLWLLLILPLVVGLKYFLQNRSVGQFKFSRSSKDLQNIEEPTVKWIHIGLYTSLVIGIALIVMGMARPYHPAVENEDQQEYGEGIDIIIALDISGSMLATDFSPNRLQAAKDVAKDFIDGRRDDRIGLVVYEGEAYTACPATRDHGFLKKSIDNVESGYVAPGTAVGVGLGTAVTRLRSDSLKSKVIILLTDGESNTGETTPLMAAELARAKDIRVYTIGVGKEGYASMPVQTIFGTRNQNMLVSIDEKTLKEIADITGGQYFRATNNNSLRDIYDKIEKMETRKMVESNLQKDPPLSPLAFLLWGILFIFLSWAIDKTLLRSIG